VVDPQRRQYVQVGIRGMALMARVHSASRGRFFLRRRSPLARYGRPERRRRRSAAKELSPVHV
jgi:hypothetical protein